MEYTLNITGKNLEYVKENFGEPENLTDEDAKAIAEELSEINERGEITGAEWWDDEIIKYEFIPEESEWDGSPDPMDTAKDMMLDRAQETGVYSYQY